jgi:hypothetical protein
MRPKLERLSCFLLEWGLQIKTNPTRLTHIPECNGRHHQSIGFNGFVEPISGMYIEKIASSEEFVGTFQ